MAKIAVIGSGISGLVTTWILSQEHEVTLFEGADYIGGHTNTRTATFGEKTVSADTGFMVFNDATYKNMLQMFAFLGVEVMDTDMAFGVSANKGLFLFSSDNVFVQKKNYFSLSHWKMIFDIIRFNRTVQVEVEKVSDTATLNELLRAMKLGRNFRDFYLLPMSGAIWSTEKDTILDFPAKQFVNFFSNHGLLFPQTLNPLKLKQGRLQWRTVKGGSQSYVQKILSQLNAEVRSDCAVTKIKSVAGGVEIYDTKGEIHLFDHVISAAHPNQYLQIKDEPTKEECDIIGAFSYSKNVTVMHKDTSFMMGGTKKWPSWTYKETSSDDVEISYYMNRLQSIPSEMPVIVTLNPSREIKQSDIFYKTVYEHPIFSIDTMRAQKNIHTIQGKQNIWFAGAWLGYGFHEDGLKSALAIGEAFGIAAPWTNKQSVLS